MRRLLNACNYVPAGVFFGFAAYYLFQIQLGLAPSDPLSWQLYLSISPLFNEASVLLAKLDVWSSVAVVSLLGLAGLLAARSESWSRFRFVHFHAALLVVFAAISNGSVYSASAGPNPVGVSAVAFNLQNIATAQPGYVALFVVILIACAKVHRSLIWSMRHPVRSVAPVAIQAL